MIFIFFLRGDDAMWCYKTLTHTQTAVNGDLDEDIFHVLFIYLLFNKENVSILFSNVKGKVTP